MTTFTIEITDPTSLIGITKAREAYNNSLPSTIRDGDGEEVVNPNLLETDADYVQFVMEKAAESYGTQYR